MKFRKKPVVVDAIQFYPALTTDELYQWAGVSRTIGHGLSSNPIPFRFADGRIYVSTLEGEMCARPGDYIIRGVAGEFYPCKPDIFAKSYEPANLRAFDGGPTDIYSVMAKAIKAAIPHMEMGTRNESEFATTDRKAALEGLRAALAKAGL